MFFTESAAHGLIDVIDVIDHAWRPIATLRSDDLDCGHAQHALPGRPAAAGVQVQVSAADRAGGRDPPAPGCAAATAEAHRSLVFPVIPCCAAMSAGQPGPGCR
jgi:hypothetical protein